MFLGILGFKRKRHCLNVRSSCAKVKILFVWVVFWFRICVRIYLVSTRPLAYLRPWFSWSYFLWSKTWVVISSSFDWKQKAFYGINANLDVNLRYNIKLFVLLKIWILHLIFIGNFNGMLTKLNWKRNAYQNGYNNLNILDQWSSLLMSIYSLWFCFWDHLFWSFWNQVLSTLITLISLGAYSYVFDHSIILRRIMRASRPYSAWSGHDWFNSSGSNILWAFHQLSWSPHCELALEASASVLQLKWY